MTRTLRPTRTLAVSLRDFSALQPGPCKGAGWRAVSRVGRRVDLLAAPPDRRLARAECRSVNRRQPKWLAELAFPPGGTAIERRVHIDAQNYVSLFFSISYRHK